MKILSENVLQQNRIDFNNNGGKTMYTYKFSNDEVNVEKKEERIDEDFTQRQEKLQSELTLLEKRKNNALECFDISYALKIQSEINELVNQIKKVEEENSSNIEEEKGEQTAMEDMTLEDRIRETISKKAI